MKAMEDHDIKKSRRSAAVPRAPSETESETTNALQRIEAALKLQHDHMIMFEQEKAAVAAAATPLAEVKGAVASAATRNFGTGSARQFTRPGGLTVLALGDLVYFTLNSGLVVGDLKLGRLGVEQVAEGSGVERGSGGTPSSEECAFRVCPKLNYRAKREYSNLLRTGGPEGSDKLAVARVARLVSQEREQNEELLGKVRSVAAGYDTHLVYGEIIQLEHCRSRRFLGVLKSDAIVNANNRRVALLEKAESDLCCYFRVMPHFKARAQGDFVFAGDDVVLEVRACTLICRADWQLSMWFVVQFTSTSTPHTFPFVSCHFLFLLSLWNPTALPSQLATDLRTGAPRRPELQSQMSDFREVSFRRARSS